MTSHHGGRDQRPERTPYEQLLEDLLVERHRRVPPPPAANFAADPTRWQPMDELTRKRVVDEVNADRDSQALITRANRKAQRRRKGRGLTDAEIESLG